MKDEVILSNMTKRWEDLKQTHSEPTETPPTHSRRYEELNMIEMFAMIGVQKQAGWVLEARFSCT
jgi:hypothetical protein